MRVALRVREVPVPDLRNHTVAEATAQLQEDGLALTVDESGRLDPKIPAGRIALQEPAPGAITRRQRSIRVWVSQGPRITVIPALTGESERAAQLRLQQDGLAVSSLAEVRSSDFPSGTVIAQEPPAQRARHRGRAARQSRRAEPLLRDARSDRRGRIARRRSAAHARIPRDDRRRAALPGVPAGHRAAPVPVGRIPDRRRRSDFAGGQPLSGKPVRIAPSILSADFAALGAAIAAAEKGGADLIHVDVMDGHFVPNITIGPPVVKSIKRVARVPLDVHLMITDPDKYAEAFVEAGADMLSVHVEVLPHLHRTVAFIKSLGVKAGVVLNPSTPVVALEEIAGDVDFVLVMSVNPGFGGQKFIPKSLQKVAAIRALLDRAGNTARRSKSTAASICRTSRASVDAGVEIVVAGSAIFNAPDPTAATKALKDAAAAVAS